MKEKLVILARVIVVIGIIVVAVIGFNVDLKYRSHKSVIIPIGEEYNMSDVKSITDEVFGKGNVILEKSGLYSDQVSIKARDITDEQLNSLKVKFNEKFNINQTIYIQIGDEFAVEDVQLIANEVLAKEDTKVEKEQENEQYAAIEANLLTEQDIENLNNKINEKYGLSNEASSISATNVMVRSDIPRVRLMDMANQYLLYTVIATVIVLVYFAIRFYKLCIKDVLFESIKALVSAELLFMAIVAITRLPINKLIVIAAFAIYIIVLAYLNGMFIDKIAAKAKK